LKEPDNQELSKRIVPETVRLAGKCSLLPRRITGVALQQVTEEKRDPDMANKLPAHHMDVTKIDNHIDSRTVQWLAVEEAQGRRRGPEQSELTRAG